MPKTFLTLSPMLSILIPFAAALLFPVAAMASKRAMELTRDPWGVLLAGNAATACVFMPLFAFDGKPPPLEQAYQPIVAGFLFFLAQIAAYKSFASGELSVAIPAQGAKVLLVAGFTVLMLDEAVTPQLWSAAALTVAALYFLQDRNSSGAHSLKRLRLTLGLALLASAAFAGFDVAVQKWTPGWGVQRFGPWVFLSQAVFSLSLLFLPGEKRWRYGPRAWGWLALGSFGMALITLSLVAVIGLYGKATLVNILFNSRCIWSVILVWLAGRWFGNREARSGRGAMSHRLLGAMFMMAAIGLALL